MPDVCLVPSNLIVDRDLEGRTRCVYLVPGVPGRVRERYRIPSTTRCSSVGEDQQDVDHVLDALERLDDVVDGVGAASVGNCWP